MDEITELETKARDLSWSLGIKLYIRGDRIYDRPPGREFDPGPGARPLPHGDLSPNTETKT